jgi:uncharacterized RDD family membrane protein YckC
MSTSVTPDQPEHTVYAGFWWRVLAFILDWIVLTVVDGIVAFAAGMEAWLHNAFALRGTIGFYTFIIGLLYFPLMESSRLRATLGKLPAAWWWWTRTAGSSASRARSAATWARLCLARSSWSAS